MMDRYRKDGYSHSHEMLLLHLSDHMCLFALVLHSTNPKIHCKEKTIQIFYIYITGNIEHFVGTGIQLA